MSDAALYASRAAAPQDDQATRLRAMVEAVERRQAVARPAVPPQPTGARVDLAAPRRRARIITVSSGKGGVGKTNTCVNLAIALTRLGKRITLLDADLGMANADVLCGLTPMRRLDQYVGVSDSAGPGAVQTRSLREIAVEAPGGFRLIPGSVGVARMADLAPREQARLLAGLADLERDADILIVDTGAGLGPEVISFINVADLALIIATPEPTSIADAYALIKCSVLAHRQGPRAHGLRPGTAAPGGALKLGLVVNQAAGQQEAAAVYARIGGVCERFLGHRLPLVGWVVQDVRVGAAVRKRRPLLLESGKCPASKDLQHLAAAAARLLEPPAPTRSGAEEGGAGPGWLSRLVLRGR